MTSSDNVTQQKALAKANNHLAVCLHGMLAEGGGNVFFSPFSVSTAMAMLLSAAQRDTASQLRAALGHVHANIPKVGWERIFEEYLSVLLKDQEAYSLKSANCMLSQKGFPVKDGYKSILTESFKALLMVVDFRGNVSEAIEVINKWISDRTNGMIPKFLKSLDKATVAVLVNAVYFKGSWLHKFSESSTSPEKFYNKGKKGKRVDMMHMKEGKFPYTETEAFQALQLPYLGEEVAMLLLLPRARDGLPAVESALSSSFLEDLEKTLRKVKVELTMPKFRLEYEKSLKPAFQRLGVQKAFELGAELGVAFGSRAIFVSDVLHKAVLEVNEEGSEASAVTVIRISSRCLPRPSPVFLADHPFALVIYDTRNKMILFMGRVEEL